MRWRELPREASWPCWWSWLGWQVGTTELGGMFWGILLEWVEGTWRRPPGSVAARRFFVELFPPLPPSTSSCLCLCLLSCARVFVTPGTVARQAPLSMELSRQEDWSGLPCPPPGDVPEPGTKPRSPTLQVDSLPSELPGIQLYLPKVTRGDPHG